MEPALPAALRQAKPLLEPLASALPQAERALDRLERDLLPRTAGGDMHLVVGIVGPNNAGKSALFNSLAGQAISPSLPSGGATRRLIGAAAPALIEVLRNEPELSRFPIEALPADGPPVESALAEPDSPADLMVRPQPALPESLLLIDTPDFDSIFRDNRLASESLLAVADVAVAVVTRHSYQNNEVVEFLRGWFEHGRPWMLVYNEAPDPEVAAAHTAKLAADVGHPPLAAFWSPHDLEVARGERPLDPQPLPPATKPLREALFDLEEVRAWKTQAMAASLEAFRADLRATAHELDARAGRADAVLTVAEEHAHELARDLALAAMPLESFLGAFREVLDERTNALSRGLRMSLRRTSDFLRSIPAKLTGKSASEQATDAGEIKRIADAECARLHGAAWAGFWEALQHDLGPAARHDARRAAGDDIVEPLDADLDLAAEAVRREGAAAAIVATPPEGGFADFQEACREMVEQEVAEHGSEWLIQRSADVATLAPLLLGTFVIFKTGGLGADVLVGGSSTGISLFMEQRLAKLLGTGVAERARHRWAAMRAPQLVDVLLDAVLPESAPCLRDERADHANTATALSLLADQIA